MPELPRANRRTAIWIGAAVVIGIVVLVAGVVLVSDLLRPGGPAVPITFERPMPGAVRADYLPDGTPVWVIGHQDWTVDVLSGFDTHTPWNLGKLNWWCPTARAIENPAHGSKWDEYGVRLGGPAPTGLPSWEVAIQGGRVVLGSLRPGPPFGTPSVAPTEQDREWCVVPAEVVFHTFDGWRVWESPTEAVASAPDDWILLWSALAVDRVGGRVFLCSLGGCEDSVLARDIAVPQPDIPGEPFPGTRYIARVRSGALIDLTQVVFVEAIVP